MSAPPSLSAGNPTPSGTRPVSIWRRKLPSLGILLLIGLAVYLLIAAFADSETAVSSPLPKGLESVSPEKGSQTVPKQSTITVDMAFDQEGVLIINGREIPQDQVVFEPSTATLRFTPGQDKDLEVLPGGVVNISTIFWPRIGTREADGQQYSWTISVT